MEDPTITISKSEPIATFSPEAMHHLFLTQLTVVSGSASDIKSLTITLSRNNEPNQVYLIGDLAKNKKEAESPENIRLTLFKANSTEYAPHDKFVIDTTYGDITISVVKDEKFDLLNDFEFRISYHTKRIA